MSTDLLARLGTALDSDYGHLTRLDTYYRGRQPLAFLDPDVRVAAGDRLFNVAANWPRLIVDTLDARLDVEGFRAPSRPQLEPVLWDMFQRNGMDEASQQAHTDALIFGRTYVSVWADENGRPRIVVESPLQTITERDPATGTTTAALKRWRDVDNYAHALLFTPSQVTTYRSRSPYPDSATLDLGRGAYEVVDVVDNPLGVVPVVPIVNRARPTLPNGESELTDVLPLADAINKMLTDMIVSAEFAAMPRRWVTGFGGPGNYGRLNAQQITEIEDALRNRMESLRKSALWVAGEPDVRFGQFPEVALDNFVGAINLLVKQVAALGGLPPHYASMAAEANPASADAIRSAEAALVNRARRRQRVWGGAWEDVMRLALHVRDGVAPVGLDDLETVWRSPEIVSIAQAADAAVKLHAEGILDDRATLEGLDYSPQAITTITGGTP